MCYKKLSKIITKDKNDNLIDEVSVYYENKDKKGSCLKEIRILDKTKLKEAIHSPLFIKLNIPQ